MPRSYVKEARKRVGPKRQRIRPIVERLAREHEDAAIALRFASPLELLVSVMLSAQTTDVNVNRVTQRLFAKYTKPEDYLAVPQEELEQDIFATGFYRQKARSLRGTMQIDRKSTRLNSSHANISYAVFCLKKKKNEENHIRNIEKKNEI